MDAISPTMPKRAEGGRITMPNGSKEKAGDDQPPPPAPAGARTIGRRAGPRHEEEQKEVVDRHDDADRGAVIAERVAYERRYERAQEGTGHADEQAA